MPSTIFEEATKRLKGTLVNNATDATKHLDALTNKQRVIYHYGKKSVAGASIFIAGTTVLDSAMKKADKYEAKAQNEQLEKKLKEQSEEEKRKREEYRHGTSFGHIDAGQIVMDMFNERIGHHKMGNSK